MFLIKIVKFFNIENPKPPRDFGFFFYILTFFKDLWSPHSLFGRHQIFLFAFFGSIISSTRNADIESA